MDGFLVCGSSEGDDAREVPEHPGKTGETRLTFNPYGRTSCH